MLPVGRRTRVVIGHGWLLRPGLLTGIASIACWHLYTATKSYANDSPWGSWFAAFMIPCLAAWVHRVVWREIIRSGSAHRVARVDSVDNTVTIASAPDEPVLRFVIRDLGDWTNRLLTGLAIGDRGVVEGPYGRLNSELTYPVDHVVRVASVEGITPFWPRPPCAGREPAGSRPKSASPLLRALTCRCSRPR